jgi:hypothetical protein
MTPQDEIEQLRNQIEQLQLQDEELEAAALAKTATPPPDKPTDPETQKQLDELRALADGLSKKVEANSAKLGAGGMGAMGGIGGGMGGISAHGTGTSFIPPVSALGNSTSPSLRSLFPDVEAAHINLIITHEFRVSDLYKLDSRYRDKEASYTFNGATGQFESSNRAAKDYKSFDALYSPLVRYFQILSAHITPRDRTMTVPFVFFQFLIHLQKIQHDYEWTAVLEYVTIFFNRRRMEMMEHGDYSRWALPDAGLMAEHVFAHKKAIIKASSSSKGLAPSRNSTPTVCRNWNSGKCTTTGTCPSGRLHVCSSCGKADHSLADHPKGN